MNGGVDKNDLSNSEASREDQSSLLNTFTDPEFHSIPDSTSLLGSSTRVALGIQQIHGCVVLPTYTQVIPKDNVVSHRQHGQKYKSGQYTSHPQRSVEGIDTQIYICTSESLQLLIRYS